VRVIVLTFWDSMGSIEAWQAPIRPPRWWSPEVQALLIRFDARVEHFDVRVDARR
jgi:hypothetical protein